MKNSKKYKTVVCPVCNDFIFNIVNTKKWLSSHKLHCFQCGWNFNIKQLKNHDLKDQINQLSINEYIIWYNNRIKKNPDYNYTEDNYIPIPHLCPVCGKYTFPKERSFAICPNCGWQDDGIMEKEPDKWAGCANDLCLNDYKKRYEKQNNQ